METCYYADWTDFVQCGGETCQFDYVMERFDGGDGCFIEFGYYYFDLPVWVFDGDCGVEDPGGVGIGGGGGSGGNPPEATWVSIAVDPDTVAPGEEANVTVSVLPQLPGIQLWLSSSESTYSGGHQHASRTSAWSIVSQGGWSNWDGSYGIAYPGSVAAGAEWIKVTAGAIVDSVLLVIRFTDLSPLGAGTGYTLGGSTSAHPANHYGTAAANAKLVAIGARYDSLTSGLVLYYNDQSLPFGGLFDIGVNWGHPHAEHQHGNEIDIQRINSSGVPSQWRAGFEAILDFWANHWQIDNGAQPNDSSHYHVRLDG